MVIPLLPGRRQPLDARAEPAAVAAQQKELDRLRATAAQQAQQEKVIGFLILAGDQAVKGSANQGAGLGSQQGGAGGVGPGDGAVVADGEIAHRGAIVQPGVLVAGQLQSLLRLT
jgi:hypothetical protein